MTHIVVGSWKSNVKRDIKVLTINNVIAIKPIVNGIEKMWIVDGDIC